MGRAGYGQPLSTYDNAYTHPLGFRVGIISHARRFKENAISSFSMYSQPVEFFQMAVSFTPCSSIAAEAALARHTSHNMPMMASQRQSSVSEVAPAS